MHSNTVNSKGLVFAISYMLFTGYYRCNRFGLKKQILIVNFN